LMPYILLFDALILLGVVTLHIKMRDSLVVRLRKMLMMQEKE